MASLFPEDDASSPAAQGAWVSAHCDGGARGNPGPAGFGAVIVDEQGLLLAELSEFLGFRTNNYAEYAGLLAVLAWALEHGHRRVRVVSDSLLMVKQIQGKFKVASPDLRPLWEEARKRIGKLERFEIAHALRHKNKVADRLANEAMDRGMGRESGSRGQGPGAITAALKATPYPRKSEAPTVPQSMGGVRETAGLGAAKSAALKPTVMLRGFVRDGVVHILGETKLPEGIFVKIVPE